MDDESVTEEEEIQKQIDSSQFSISATAAAAYAFCCLLFLAVVAFLYFCKCFVIDADPKERSPAVRYVRGKQQPTFSTC